MAMGSKPRLVSTALLRAILSARTCSYSSSSVMTYRYVRQDEKDKKQNKDKDKNNDKDKDKDNDQNKDKDKGKDKAKDNCMVLFRNSHAMEKQRQRQP